MSSQNPPPFQRKRISIAEALAMGELGALLIVKGEHHAAWSIPDWIAQDMTRPFADELVESLRAALYDSIRPKG